MGRFLNMLITTMTIQAVLQKIIGELTGNFTVSVVFPVSVTGLSASNFNVDARVV